MALLVYGSLFKFSKIPKLDLVFQDKLIHFTAYALLCFVIFFLLVINKINNRLEKTITASIVFGVVIEILQVIFTSHRAFEFYDIVANTAGILTTSQLIHLKKSFIVKKLESFM